MDQEVLLGNPRASNSAMLRRYPSSLPMAERIRARRIPSRALYPIESVNSGCSVVTTAPVSMTNRPTTVLSGPVTKHSTMSSSPSVTNKLSCLVIENDGWTGWALCDASGVVVADQVVVPLPGACLLERCATRFAVSDDARSSKQWAISMFALHLDDAHPFVGMSRADLGPRERLGDLTCHDLGGFGSNHSSDDEQRGASVKFSAVDGPAVTGRRSSSASEVTTKLTDVSAYGQRASVASW